MEQMENTTRVTATLPYDMLMRVNYWAAKKNMSANQYLAYALKKFIEWDASDHSKPTQEIQRLNTCISAVTDLNESVRGLQHTVDSGFDALLSVTRGDNQLLKHDDGDIDPIVLTKDLIAKKRSKKHRKGQHR